MNQTARHLPRVHDHQAPDRANPETRLKAEQVAMIRESGSLLREAIKTEETTRRLCRILLTVALLALCIGAGVALAHTTL